MSTPDRDPKHLYPPFAEKAHRILTQVNAWCAKNAPRFHVILGEGYRSRARQQALYAQGRTTEGSIVTKLDGVKQVSGHQTCLAFDLWLERDGKVVWDKLPELLLQFYGHCCRAEGLVWGGDWNSDQRSSDERFVDMPHCEWPRDQKAVYAAAAAWKKAQGLA